MTIPEFLQQLHNASQNGYLFQLAEGHRIGKDGQLLLTHPIFCRKVKNRCFRQSKLPVEAVCHFLGHRLPKNVPVYWIAACDLLGLSWDDGGKILRAGNERIVYWKGRDKPGVTYSRRLRKDMLEACGLADPES